DNLRLTHGDASDKARMGVGVPKTKASYVTAPLHSGLSSDPVEAFQGAVTFNLAVKSLNNTTTNVAFDLAEMGATPRTMGNVV
ncbi:hypothetical protein, partial [Priestia megaterium]|uniref:hypothetical protein n=1 Tax=Priestia megaterium TaxID=1404 RepID=UPI0035B69173